MTPGGAARRLWAAIHGPCRRALVCGTAGSVAVTVGGFVAGAVPVDGGPAVVLGLPWLLGGHGAVLGLVVTWFGVVLLAGAWLALGPRAARRDLSTGDAAAAVTLWSLPLLPAVPMFSRDAWSYLAQGAMVAAGADPYTDGPEAAPGVFTDQVSPDWRSTPTPYGPVHLVLMRAVTTLSGPHPLGAVLILRLGTLAVVAGLCLALVAVARRTGTAPGTALWCGAASPLVVLHLVGGLHNEALPVACTVAAVALAWDGRRFAAPALIGIAVAVKVTAVVVAPFLLWILWRRRTGDRPLDARTRRTGVADLACVVAVPVAVAAVASYLGSGFGWISGLAVSDLVVNYLSLPTAVAHLAAAVGVGSGGFDADLEVSRAASRYVLAAVLVAVWVLSARTARRALRGIVLAVLAFVLLNTVSWPWYHTWLGAHLPPVARDTRVLGATAVGVVFLVSVIGPNGSTSLYSPPLVVVSVVSAAATAWWWHRRVPTNPAPTNPGSGGTKAPGEEAESGPDQGRGLRTPSPAPGA